MHTVSVSGKVGSVQLRKVGDTSVLNFNLASSEYVGKDKKATTWFKCSLWGTHAENIAKHVEVGKGLFLTGTLKPDEHGNPKVYETSGGEHRASFELNVDRVEFTSPSPKNSETSDKPVDEDDIPF